MYPYERGLKFILRVQWLVDTLIIFSVSAFSVCSIVGKFVVILCEF